MATRTPDGVGGSNDVWCGASLDREGAVAPEEGERVEASVPSPTLAARVAYFIEWLGNTVALWWLNSDHKLQQQRVRFIAGALFLVAMLVCSVSASAFTGLDPLMAQYEGMGSGFMAGSLNLAIALSGGLLACVLLYRFVKSIAHANGNLRSVLPGGLVLLLETYVPWQIVLWTPSLLGNLMNLARTISNKIGVTPITSPDTIVSTGINLGFGTFGNIMTTYLAAIPQEAAQLPPCTGNPLQTLGCQVGHWAQIGAATASAEHNLTTVMVVAGVLCGVIIYVFGMLAAELLMATIQVSITIPMGAWTLGFTGTPLQGAAGNVWGAIMGAIARWLTVFVLVTVALQTATLIGNSLAVGFKPTLPQNLGQGFSDLLGTNFGWFRPVCGAAIGCLVLMKITSKCADLAESVMSGRSVMQGASAVSGAVGGVGSSIGGAAIGAVRGGPMGAAAGAMSGARSAASSTLNRMK